MKLKLLVTAALTLLFTACSSIGTTPTEAISFAGIVDGTAASPTLNGQKLVLSGANITQDEEEAKASDLRPGMEIAGKGISNGTEIEVESLEFEDRVKGQIDVINTTENTLDVAGIRIALDSNSKIVNRNSDGTLTDITLADLKGDDYIEVHGVPRNDDGVNKDSVLGMFIVRKIEDNLKVEFRMHIRNLDSAAKTFTYGLQTYTVDFSAAEVRGNLVDNAMVRVRGYREGQVIKAERVRYGNDDSNGNHGDDHGKYELKGPVSNLDTAAKTFTLLDFSVDYSAAKVEGNLSEGVWVEVKGLFDSTAKTIKASKVETKNHHDDDDDNDDNDDDNDLERKGTIEAIDATAMTLTVSGINYWANSATKVENESSHISFADLKTGDFVEVYYDLSQTNADGHSYASKIEIKTGDDNSGSDDSNDDN